jgi:hypothetical protein
MLYARRREVFRPQLHDREGAGARARIHQTDRFHRTEGKRQLAAGGHDLYGQASLEVADVFEASRFHFRRLREAR